VRALGARIRMLRAGSSAVPCMRCSELPVRVPVIANHIHSARATLHLLPCAVTLHVAGLPSNAGALHTGASKGTPWQAGGLLAPACSRWRAMCARARAQRPAA